MLSTRSASLRIGISGWNYPPWRGGTFYPKGLPRKRELEYASRQVNSIEINGTFYSLQRPENLRAQYEATPETFISVKGSRFIVRMKRLTTHLDVEIRPLLLGSIDQGEVRRSEVTAGRQTSGEERKKNEIDLLEEAFKIIPFQTLVNVVIKRVRQLIVGHRPMISVGPRAGFVEVALSEIIEGKLLFDIAPELHES